MNSCLRNDFTKPQRLCALTVETGGLFAELYGIAAQFYSMIGEYDTSDRIADQGRHIGEKSSLPDANDGTVCYFSPGAHSDLLQIKSMSPDEIPTGVSRNRLI